MPWIFVEARDRWIAMLLRAAVGRKAHQSEVKPPRRTIISLMAKRRNRAWKRRQAHAGGGQKIRPLVGAAKVDELIEAR